MPCGLHLDPDLMGQRCLEVAPLLTPRLPAPSTHHRPSVVTGLLGEALTGSSMGTRLGKDWGVGLDSTGGDRRHPPSPTPPPSQPATLGVLAREGPRRAFGTVKHPIRSKHPGRSGLTAAVLEEKWPSAPDDTASAGLDRLPGLPGKLGAC